MRFFRSDSVGLRLRAAAVAVVLVAALVSAAFRTCDAADKSADKRAAAAERAREFTGRYETAKHLVSIGELKEANSQIKKLRKRARGDVEKAMAEEALASYYLARHELPDAEKRASAAVDLHPAFSTGFRTRALVRVERGNLRGAEEDYRAALSFDGSDKKSLKGLVDVYLAQNRGPEALPLLERYLDLDSTDAWAQDGWTRLKAVELGYESFPLDYLRCLRNAAVTRGELAAILVVALETEEKIPSASGLAPEAGPSTSPLHQPGEGARGVRDYGGRWYAPFVDKALVRGLGRRFPDGTFRPDDRVTKGLLANEIYGILMKDAPAKVERVLVRPMEVPSPVPRDDDSPRVPGSGYSDVFILSYLWRPVRVAVELGVLRPESDSVFGVDSLVSGQEAARAAESLARILHSP